MRGLFTTTLFCLLVVALVNGASLRTSKASSSLKAEISELIKIKNQVKYADEMFNENKEGSSSQEKQEHLKALSDAKAINLSNEKDIVEDAESLKEEKIVFQAKTYLFI